MLKMLSGRSAELGPDLMDQLAKFRHKVFIRELGWTLPAVDGLEVDQFDRADTIYVVAFDRNAEIVGCGRLLPTNETYLLAAAFPGLMNGATLPSTRDVWELSRFAIGAPSGELMSAQESWQNTCQLMAEIVRVAQTHNADRLIAFSVIGNERLLRRMGVNVHRAAPPQLIDGKPTLPFWIEIDEQTCTALKIDSQPGWLSRESPNLYGLHARKIAEYVE
ncbi:MAG TPA: acyl-homoserine-lactone synthase [Trinickia sp.]|jgi:acyl homoserine lactone synthase|nr:acyl-homoserine-lactone synthase [Trinickia sp.]